MDFETTHKLAFYAKPWERDPRFTDFKVGSVHGLYYVTFDSYRILSVINKYPGNGHLDDVLQWFENSCKRDKKHLILEQFFNKKFKKHLIRKRGFEKMVLKENSEIEIIKQLPQNLHTAIHDATRPDGVIKYYTQMK